MRRLLSLLLLSIVLAAPAAAQSSAPRAEPRIDGATSPPVVPQKGDDGIYHQSWFVQGFLDLKDDHGAGREKGRNFAVVFEQRGCIYCTKMHTEVLAQRYINDYVRENFDIVQLDLFGSREVTDFDGTRMPEKKLAERWGVLFTPTIVFFKEDVSGLAGQWGAPLELARMSLGFGAPTFIDLFAWVRTRAYEKDRNFQRYHIERMARREAMKPRTN
jgi:thioredoxin-related protein